MSGLLGHVSIMPGASVLDPFILALTTGSFTVFGPSQPSCHPSWGAPPHFTHVGWSGVMLGPSGVSVDHGPYSLFFIGVVLTAVLRLDAHSSYPLTIALTDLCSPTPQNPTPLDPLSRMGDQLSFWHRVTLGSVNDGRFSHIVGMYPTGFGKTLSMLLVPRILDVLWPLSDGRERTMYCLSPLKRFAAGLYFCRWPFLGDLHALLTMP